MLVFLATGMTEAQEPPVQQLTGLYRFEDGEDAIIIPSSIADVLRYVDTESGKVHHLTPDGPLDFHSGAGWNDDVPVAYRYRFRTDDGGRAVALTVTPVNGEPRAADWVHLPEIATEFPGDGVKLFGKLVLPDTSGPHPAVVIAQGSEASSAIERYWEPYLYAANGIATLVYDKRGTGRSEGEYTQNFPTLARDLLGGVAWLKSIPEIDVQRIGVAGFSQGGWIAPMAALESSDLSFVLVGYGLAMSVADEDRIEAPRRLALMGFDSMAVSEFEDLNGALHDVARKGFVDWGPFKEKLAEYSARPWFEAVPETRGWAAFVITTGLEDSKVIVPSLIEQVDPFYDPVRTLEALDTPMLWLIAEDDIEAPPEITIEVLQRLRAKGKPYQTIVFPGADHGIIEYRETSSGREPIRYGSGFMHSMVTWLREQTGLSLDPTQVGPNTF